MAWKCIIVDDEPVARNILEEFISEVDYLDLAGKAENPLKAETLLNEGDIDLIFLDINMPSMDGWEFLEKYKELKKENSAQIIIIMLTTSLNPDDVLRAYQMPEISGFENKPLTTEKIDRIVKKYFGNVEVKI